MSADPVVSQGPTLRRVMGGREYFTLAFGSIVGVGWMVVIEDWLKRGGPGGAMIAYLIGGIALVPVVLVYGRLARLMPEAASEIAYTAAVFPRGVSFATGWCMTFAYLIVCPYEAVAIGRLAAYVFPEMNRFELYSIGGFKVFLPNLLLGVAVTFGITLLNYRGIQFSSRFQNWTTFGLLGVFCVFTPLGIWRGSTANWEPLFVGETKFLAVLAVMPIVPYYLTGFETIPKCSEEAASDFEPRRFVWIMLLALAVGTFFYMTVVGVVSLLVPWPTLTTLPDGEFATAYAFQQAFGSPWLVRFIMLGAVLSLLKVFNGMFLSTTRLLYALGKRELVSGGLGAVNQRFQTPHVAILLVGAVTLLASLLGRVVLVPISEVGTLAGALGWLAASLACAFGAGGPASIGVRVLGACGAVISLALAVIAVQQSFGPYHLLTVGLWGLLGMVLWLGRPRN